MLEEKIALLARAVRNAVEKYKSENRIKISKRTFIRRCDMELRYVDNVGLGRFPHQRIENDVWDLADLQAFSSTVLMALDEHESLAAALAETNNNSPSIDNFVRVTALASYKGLSDEKLMAYANQYGGELNGVVHVTARVDGISISESPLAIADWMVLRHPVAEDMAEYVGQDGVGGVYGPKGFACFRVIGEFNFGPTFEMAQDHLLRVLAALRLFRVGGVVSNRYWTKGSFVRPDTGVGVTGGPSARFFTLSPSDSSAIVQFLDDIVPIITEPGSEASTIEIANSRYTSAVFQYRPEEVITSSVTSLEALFLNNEPELQHRLAQRVSIFLRLLGSQPDGYATYNATSKGYRIRSKFIHGDSLKPRDQPEANRIAPMLLDYARASVLAFLQLTPKKTELLQQLDRATIDPSCVAALESQLAMVRHK